MITLGTEAELFQMNKSCDITLLHQQTRLDSIFCGYRKEDFFFWLLFNDGSLQLKAAMCVREHAVIEKVRKHETAGSFCAWVNLTISCLQVTYSLILQVLSAYILWQSHKKGAYIDGHEKSDMVVRHNYLDRLQTEEHH